MQRFYRARFPDSGFAEHGDDLAASRTSQPPAVEHQLHFLCAADERQLAAHARPGESAVGRGLAHDAPHPRRAREPSQFAFSLGLELKQAGQQAPRGLADEDLTGPCERLQPRRKIGCLADDRPLLRGGPSR
jgi:hypothetical protein